MSVGILLVSGALVAAVATAAAAKDAAAPPAAALGRVAQRRVLFAHQSVGASLLAGLQRLAAGAGVPLRVAEVASGQPLGPGVHHFFVPENGDPRRKLASFAKAIQDRAAEPPEIAVFKFCYVDFDAGTDPDALFSEYEATLSDLQRRFPGTTFVHTTVPLTTVQGGLKNGLKRLLGKAPYGFVENERREAFNAKLRAAHPGPALFDLARLEATTAGGGTASSSFGGRSVLQLDPAHTPDGGHLDDAAQDRIAAALAALLAAL